MDNFGSIIVHPGRAHVDDFLAACVCIHHTGLPLFRMNCEEPMLANPDFWVLDQGMRFEPELHNFDHHHLDRQICSLTMVLDHLYDWDYRSYMPQLSYIEIHDSKGASKAAKFAGISHDQSDCSASLIQHMVLKSFSEIEGRVADPFYSLMKSFGLELCSKIESLPSLVEQLESNSRLIDSEGISVLDLTSCEAEKPDHLPTKLWCNNKRMCPDVILTRDSRSSTSYRMIGINNRVRFAQNNYCSYTHPSGFMTVFENLNDWPKILHSSADYYR